MQWGRVLLLSIVGTTTPLVPLECGIGSVGGEERHAVLMKIDLNIYKTLNQRGILLNNVIVILSPLALQIVMKARDVLAIVMDSGQEDLEAVEDNHCI